MELLNRSEKAFKVFSYILVIVFAAITLYPVIYAFSVSITARASGSPTPTRSSTR